MHAIRRLFAQTGNRPSKSCQLEIKATFSSLLAGSSRLSQSEQFDFDQDQHSNPGLECLYAALSKGHCGPSIAELTSRQSSDVRAETVRMAPHRTRQARCGMYRGRLQRQFPQSVPQQATVLVTGSCAGRDHRTEEGCNRQRPLLSLDDIRPTEYAMKRRWMLRSVGGGVLQNAASALPNPDEPVFGRHFSSSARIRQLWQTAHGAKS